MSSFSFCVTIIVLMLHFHYAYTSACREDERSYLLDFKSCLVDSTGRLSSWQHFNCCQWEGVMCDYHSGHVVSLDLKNGNHSLSGTIHLSLFNLQYLQYLDLSWNNFNGVAIPTQFEKLQRLTFLSLRCARFGGEIPMELGNLTNLRHLDLSTGVFFDFSTAFLNDLKSTRFAGWIRNLRSLEYLAMRYVNLSMANEHWSDALNSLPNLTQIYLFENGFSGTMPSFLNLTRLSHLHLGFNSFPFPIPYWFQNVFCLVSLDLYHCDLKGSIPSNFLHRSSMRNIELSSNYNLGGVIPHSIANFSMLQTLSVSWTNLTGDLSSFGSASGLVFALSKLDLSHNNLKGSIPSSLGRLSSLIYLDLSYNQLNGQIPLSLGQLYVLRELHLYNNQLSGNIPVTFSKLVRLERLLLRSNSLTGIISLSVLENLLHLKEVDFSENRLTVDVSSSWLPQFAHLKFLWLQSCNLQGEIPAFLSTQYSLEILDLSDNNMVGNIPTWLLELPSLYSLNLSHNRLEGTLPPVISITVLDMHNNSLRGSLPDCTPYVLDMSENEFTGSIPGSICSAKISLVLMDLSTNRLSGVIPPILGRCSDISILNLAQNNLQGEIPKELANLTYLETLNLRENNLQGIIPPTIANCRNLKVFDIANNRIQGSIPVWIGELVELRILSLAFNKFQGSFPLELLKLGNLQILDLSHNNLSGLIPHSLGELSAMVNQSQTSEIQESLAGMYVYGYLSQRQIVFVNQLTLWIKGRATAYPKIISAFKFMDLSHNKLSGNIPEEMGDLNGLIALNISNNSLRGSIPGSLGGMAHLESLDLSGNMLSGKIPEELVNLTFLSVLNLSHNNLSGFIPQGKQFATFEASSYLGNPNLHGPPLENGKLRSGSGERGNQVQWNSTGVRDTDAAEMERWWAVSVGLCFGVGFATVIAVLCFHLKWRFSCFALMDGFIQYLFER